MNVSQLLAKCEGICLSVIYFHLFLPIITSERDRDTHRSLFMSNMHFELRNEWVDLVKEMNSYND